jgi:hypothetical protein
MDKIESYQFQSFSPNAKTKNNLGVPNTDTEITLNVGDGWIHPHAAQLYMKTNVIHENGSDYSEYEGKGNVKLVENFVCHLL